MISRLQDKLSSGGLRYLAENGAVYTNCKFSQSNTQASCGDAVIATGSLPWTNGIIGDQWFDRKRNKTISSVFDENAQLVGANGQAAGNKLLMGTTLGDQMKLASNYRSKVVSLAVNDSQALLLSGKLANSVAWLDQRTGNFVGSNQLMADIPNFVKAFNEQRQAEAYVGKPWQRLAAENLYGPSTRDDYSAERALPSDGRAFPHMIANPQASGEGAYSTLAITPMANQMVLDLAKDAIEKESLGSHLDPDLLILGLSAGNKLVSNFGPNSQEAQDLVMRLDQGINNLLNHLDQKIGLNNCLVIFTANSGAQAIPEFVKERGLDGGRIDPKNLQTTLDNQLDRTFGQDDWVASVDPPNVYLNFAAIDKLPSKSRQQEVEALAALAARSVPGVAQVITQNQLFTNQLPSSPLAEAARKSNYWGRSGELLLIPKPGYIFSGESTGTANGSPYSADSQVPLLLMGSGIAAGRYPQSVNPQDIAPTVCAILGIDSPAACEGKPLSDCFSQFQGPPRARQ
jgi:hypothetical protein